MSMFRSYLLKNEFWAKKGNEASPNQKIFIRHDSNIGGIYAIIRKDTKGVKIIADGEEHFFDNFDRLDLYLNQLSQKKDNFMKIIKRRNISRRLRTLDL